MRTINYESDFKIIEGFKDDSSILAAPFRFTYYTKVSRGVYVAEYNGSEFVNCHPSDDGRVIVPFDSPKLGMGVLMVKREFFLSDSDFKDGICNLVSVESTGIMLDRGATDMDGEVNIELFPFYQQGETGKSAYDEWLELGNTGTVEEFLNSMRGEPFTYEDFTPEQLAALKGADGKDGRDGKSFTYQDMTEAEKKDLASHIQVPEGSVTEDKLSQEVQDKLNQAGSGYEPPVGGIPKKDLSQEVQASLGKADTALQEHQSLADYAKKGDVQDAIDLLSTTMLTTEPAEGEEVTDYVLMASDVEQTLGDSDKPISQAAVKSAINSIESMIITVINTPT